MQKADMRVTSETRDALNAARVDLFADAGQVLNASGRIQFLLGVWRAVRHTEQGAEAIQLVARNLAQASGMADGRCAG